MKKIAVAAIVVAITNAAGMGPSTAGDLLQVEGAPVKWQSPFDGTPAIITYATVASSYVFPDEDTRLSPDNCGAMSAFRDSVAASVDVTETVAKDELRAALNAWEGVANITFVEVTDVHTANIVVGSAASTKGRAFANLSFAGDHGEPVTKGLGHTDHNEQPATKKIRGSGTTAIRHAYVCLNPEAHWKVGFDGDLSVYDLRFTFMHEIGHAIGLDHPGRSGAVMAYRYDEKVRQLQPSDIAAVQRLYGPASHANPSLPNPSLHDRPAE